MSQSKLEVLTCSWRKARENARWWVTIDFGFTSDWMKKWREFFLSQSCCVLDAKLINHFRVFLCHMKTSSACSFIFMQISQGNSEMAYYFSKFNWKPLYYIAMQISGLSLLRLQIARKNWARSGLASPIISKVNCCFLSPQRVQSTYFLTRVDPRMTFVVIFNSKRPEKDSFVTSFLTGMSARYSFFLISFVMKYNNPTRGETLSSRARTALTYSVLGDDFNAFRLPTEYKNLAITAEKVCFHERRRYANY